MTALITFMIVCVLLAVMAMLQAAVERWNKACPQCLHSRMAHITFPSLDTAKCTKCECTRTLGK